MATLTLNLTRDANGKIRTAEGPTTGETRFGVHPNRFGKRIPIIIGTHIVNVTLFQVGDVEVSVIFHFRIRNHGSSPQFGHADFLCLETTRREKQAA